MADARTIGVEPTMAEASFDPRNVCTDTCGACDRVHAGEKVCTGRRGCPVYERHTASTQGASKGRGHEVLGRKAASKRSLVASLGVLLGLAACSSVPLPACGPNDVPTRWSQEQIDQMTDEQVRNELARNEDLALRGCALPNK